MTAVVQSAADHGVQIIVSTKAFSREAEVTDFEMLDVTACHLARGTAEFTVDEDDDVNDWLKLPGARVTIILDGEVLLSGQVVERRIRLVADGPRRYLIRDDWAILDNLAYVVPGGRLRPSSLDDLGQAVEVGLRRSGTVEGQDGYYGWPAGITAETAVYRLLSQNLAERLGLPVRFAADRARGGRVELPSVRFGRLEEYVVRILTAAGLGLRVWHDPALGPWINFEVFQPNEYEQELDSESGVIVDGEAVIRAPETTRALILASGEDSARDFQEYRDETGLEREWGLVREATKDATGSAPKYAEDLPDEFQVGKYFELRGDSDPVEVAKYRAARAEAGVELLADGLPKAGIDAKLAEEGDFFFGPGGFQLGDRVRIRAGGEPIPDRITEVRVVIEPGDTGRDITPIVGNYTDDPQRSTRDAIDRIAADNERRYRR